MKTMSRVRTVRSQVMLSGLVLGMAGMLLVATGAAVFAHSAAVKSACKTDYFKFCPNYKLDTPQMRACMRSAGGNLSRRCVDALADAGEISRKYHSSNLKR